MTLVKHHYHSCLPCFYQLYDEPELNFSCLVSIDGNNSLKHLRMSVRGVNKHLNTRSITSDHWVYAEDVDCFKGEALSQVSMDQVEICHTDANHIL
jgi:hypothetical protein